MKTGNLIFLLFICLFNTAFGQESGEITGRVISRETKETIPYANIYNLNTKRGTISNTDGYFRIPVRSINDSIRISFIGFRVETFTARPGVNFYVIPLAENVYLQDEITVRPADISWLIELIHDCKKGASQTEQNPRTYYELKSYVNNAQVELVEGYYNARIRGYELKDLQLKAGRLALQPYENRVFASMESSRALLMLNLMKSNDYFPVNPLGLSRSEMKKKFWFSLENKYPEGETDSIYVIEYKPKDTTGLYFNGKIWLNKTKRTILKITLNCVNASRHPFLPIHKTDSISSVRFNITYSFKSVQSKAVFNHIDFVYVIGYKSRFEKEKEYCYSVKTKAVLYAYNYVQPFQLPFFEFSQKMTGDYSRYNAIPYNDFFWKNNDEYKLNDSLNTNESFFANINSVTNQYQLKLNQRSFFEQPFLGWSEKRVRFREIFRDTTLNEHTGNYKSEQYKLDVKIFLDINSYNDTTNILTATVFDPFESYYHLPIDNQTHCFVNIFFDLCETERRKLEAKLKAETSDFPTVKKIYKTFLSDFEWQKNKYLKAVDRGTNRKELLKYNQLIYEQLGINNAELFQPSTKEMK